MEGDRAKTIQAFATFVQGHSAANERSAVLKVWRNSRTVLRASKYGADAILSALLAVPAQEHPVGHACILCVLVWTASCVLLHAVGHLRAATTAAGGRTSYCKSLQWRMSMCQADVQHVKASHRATRNMVCHGIQAQGPGVF